MKLKSEVNKILNNINSTIAISITLNVKLLLKLDKLSRIRKINRSKLINSILQVYFNELEKTQ